MNPTPSEVSTALARIEAQEPDWQEICERNCIPAHTPNLCQRIAADMTATDKWLCAFFLFALAVLFGDGVFIAAGYLIFRGIKAAFQAMF